MGADMTEFGIYSEPDGGFAETQFASRDEATARLSELVAGGEYDAEDVTVLEICPDHEEQPRDTCEECAAEEDEEDEG